MHSASSGTPGSHTPAGNFPVSRHSVAHGHTTVPDSRYSLRADSLVLFLEREKKESAVKRNRTLISGSARVPPM